VADELLADGTAQLRLGDRTTDPRLIRFWHGDDVLHLLTDGHGEFIAASAASSAARMSSSST
jgi:hypothetical protein